MARIPTPWFWEERAGWYVNKDGQRHFLGEHPEGAPPPRKHNARWNAPQPIMQAFHELMAKKPETPPAPQADGLSVAEIFDKYLAWCQKHREPRTYEWYHDHIQNFINRKPEAARLPATELKPFHVVEWADSHGEAWSPAYRRGGIIAIQRPFNWAADLGYIDASPIRKIPKPQPQRREQFVSPEEWVKIRDHYAEDDPFRDLLEFGWETGCRPQESRRIEARHVDLEHHRVVFPPAEAKGKKRWRIIRLTPRAEEIIQRHLEQYPEGVLFRNQDGQPWTAYAIACRFGRLKKHLGVRYAAYDRRHGFCQDLLEQGNDATTVAELMGHANSSMVSRVYSHMNKAESHLQRVLERRQQNGQAQER